MESETTEQSAEVAFGAEGSGHAGVCYSGVALRRLGNDRNLFSLQSRRAELPCQQFEAGHAGATNTDASLTIHHLPKKGDAIAVSKSTRRSVPNTNQSLKDIFRNSQFPRAANRPGAVPWSIPKQANLRFASLFTLPSIRLTSAPSS